MKRYKEYKDSGVAWLGEVPSHWEVKRIKYVSRFNPNSKRKFSPEMEVSYAPMNHVRWNKIEPDSILWGSQSTGLNYFENGDILMAKVTPCFENGNIAIAKNLLNGAGVCSSELFVFRPFTINRNFLFYILQHSELKREFVSSMRGTGGLKRIEPELIYNYRIPIPPLDEQEAIADYLDSKCGEIDAMMSKIDEKISLFQRMRSAIITKAVTKGLNTSVELRPSGVNWLGDIPAHWEIIPLKSLGRMNTGLNFTKSDLVDNGVAVISYGQIHSKTNSGVKLNKELLRFIPQEICNNNFCARAERGNIIFADTSEDLSGCGNAVYVDSDEIIYAGYHTIIIHCSNIDGKYYAYLFKTDDWRSQIRCRVTGTKVFSITQTILKSCSVLVPPLSEQLEITEYLDRKCGKIDELVSKYSKQKELLERYRKALISQVVTGQRCVCEPSVNYITDLDETPLMAAEE